jgi:type III restriction enzyme
MPRRKRATPDNAQADLLDVASKLRTAPCVPALREAVKAWVAGGYKGITDTTRILLNYWFYTDHKLATGAPFPRELPANEDCNRTRIELY